MSARHLLLPLIVGCVAPEEGIDNTRVTGTVVIEPVRLAEADLVSMGTTGTAGTDVAGLATPATLPELYLATLFVSGTLDAAPTAGQPDIDGYVVTSRNSLPDASWHFTVDGTATVEIWNMDTFTLVNSGVITDEGDLTFPAPAAPTTGTGDTATASVGPGVIAGTRYGFRLIGPDDGSAVTYEVRMVGDHPKDAGIKVGAWPGDDPTALGNPVGGSTVEGWRGSDWTWTGTFEIYLLRTVVPPEDPDGDPPPAPDVTEGVSEAWLFAGDWPSLNSPLAAGTYYSATPQKLIVPDEVPRSTWFQDAVVVEIVDPLQLDTVAEAIIGNTFDEGPEPNGLQAGYPWAVNLGNIDDVPDVGLLSGPGFADLFQGSITYGPGTAGYGYGYAFDHDTDTWAFQVPAPSRLVFSLDWGDASACLDAIITDSVDGLATDIAGSYDKPDVGGGVEVYEPGTTYLLTVLGYFGVPEGDATDYTLLVEQIDP